MKYRIWNPEKGFVKGDETRLKATGEPSEYSDEVTTAQVFGKTTVSKIVLDSVPPGQYIALPEGQMGSHFFRGLVEKMTKGSGDTEDTEDTTPEPVKGKGK